MKKKIFIEFQNNYGTFEIEAPEDYESLKNKIRELYKDDDILQLNNIVYIDCENNKDIIIIIGNQDYQIFLESNNNKIIFREKKNDNSNLTNTLISISDNNCVFGGDTFGGNFNFKSKINENIKKIPKENDGISYLENNIKELENIHKKELENKDNEISYLENNIKELENIHKKELENKNNEISNLKNNLKELEKNNKKELENKGNEISDLKNKLKELEGHLY